MSQLPRDQRPQSPPPTAAPARFDTRAQLHGWLEQQGLAHVARFNLEALAPGVEPALWPRLRAVGARRRLIDLACAETLARSEEWLPPSPLREVLPGLVSAFIDSERAGAQRARAALTERLEQPAEPSSHEAHQRLCELRRGVPDGVAPRPTEALRLDELKFDRALPGFRFVDLLPTEQTLRAGGAFARAKVQLTLLPGASRAECSCGLSPCVHVLAAIDTALLWLKRGADPAALAELSRPAWQRTLAALDAALATSPAASTPGQVWWRVQVGEGVEVTAWLGDRAVSRRELLEQFGTALPAVDSRVAALLPESGQSAGRALLEALVDHPRVLLGDTGQLAVRVERAPVGLVAEERLGSVKVSAGLEGAALPPYLAERVRRERPGEVLFVWDEGPRRLTLLDVTPQLREVLSVLHQQSAVFPPESHGALLESLSKWAQRLPVAMPRSVLGEAVPAVRLPVLRLQVQPQGAVELEVRMRALPDAPALLPGEGARDVHLRRGEKPVHAVRDFEAERAAAAALCAELPLGAAEVLDGPFHFRFERAQDALGLLEACSRRAPPPELEWVGPALRTLGGTGPRALKVAVQHHLEWFGLLGALSVEGERVELARLLDAARRKARYVQVSTYTWVELSEVLRRHLERLADHAQAGRQGLAVGPAAMASLRALQSAGATVEADAAWEQLARRVEAARALEPKVPRGLKAKLRPYQREGYQWLSRLAAWGAGGVLADDMGLGKTVQALTLLLERAASGPALVVAPTSVAFNWKEEASRFAPSLKLLVYADLQDRARPLGPQDVLVVSYGLLLRDAKALSTRRFSTVVFDEAQNLKNAHTQRFAAARALRADFKVALSGTPIENHLGELWSLFALVFPTLLGSAESFQARFALPIETTADPAAGAALSRVIEPFLLRRTKAEVESELPPRTEVRVPVVLSSAEWQLYEDTRLAALSDLQTPKKKMREQQRRVQVLALLTRLRLVASHPRLHVPNSPVSSSKLQRLLELIDELRAEGQRTLVFSQFTSHLALVREALDARGIAHVGFDGSTPRKQRAERIAGFQAGTAPVFLLSLKAGGVGLNLTAASNVIHLDPWWNPAVEDQASDRAHRLGQQRPVTIYRLVSMGTVEELMLSLHERKRALVSAVLSGKARPGTPKTEELMALLASPHSTTPAGP